MPKLMFFDTETTGNTADDSLCQIAYKYDGEIFTALYQPRTKIPPEASAVHHITNKMVADKPAFQASPEYQKIKALFEDPEAIPVAHNAPLDVCMLKNEGIEVKNFICTLRVARALDTEEKIERYNLQYLRYFLEIEVEAAAHDALGDVLVLEELFLRLRKKIMETEKLDEAGALAKMQAISAHPSFVHTFRFGKYNGQKVQDVARTDRGYLEWLLAEKEKSGQPDEDWIYTLKHCLGKV